MIVIGVDVHKQSVTAVAVDEAGRRKLDPDTPAGTSDTLISEAAIRAMYRHWREAMEL